MLLTPAQLEAKHRKEGRLEEIENSLWRLGAIGVGWVLIFFLIAFNMSDSFWVAAMLITFATITGTIALGPRTWRLIQEDSTLRTEVAILSRALQDEVHQRR